jgi:hypothetical protein
MVMLDVYTISGCKLFQLLFCFLIVYPEVIEVNWWTWLRSDVWSALIVLSITLSDHSNWCLPWTLSFLDVVNVLQSLLLMSLHVVLPHLSLFRCTCSGCCSFCYHLRVGLTPVFECLLQHLWLPLVLVLSYSCDWLTCRCFKLLVPDFMMSGYWCWLHYSHTSVSPAT